jgi:prepilin-type N-terminal cleavage/methylation domain-containing protein
MSTNHAGNKKNGLCLIEVMVAMAVLLVGILGTMCFRYHCALNCRKADAHNSAVRIGGMLLEGWKATGAENDFDTVGMFSSDVTISTSNNSPTPASGFSELGRYHIINDQMNYYATLSYKDSDAATPKTLNASVYWLNSNQSGSVGTDAQSIRVTKYAHSP